MSEQFFHRALHSPWGKPEKYSQDEEKTWPILALHPFPPGLTIY
ncbi:hypothetical protein [Pseudomonas aeruginosa]|nr:hypothetical protein [Pseudomonas aeruginosa]MDF5809253.1 hypothetical protein [Pseudomonas aeruginosa]